MLNKYSKIVSGGFWNSVEIHLINKQGIGLTPGADLGEGCRGCAPNHPPTPPLPPPRMTCGFLIQLVFCKKKTMWFIGVEVEQETSAPPPTKNSGSAPGLLFCFVAVAQFFYPKELRYAWCQFQTNLLVLKGCIIYSIHHLLHKSKKVIRP